MLDLFIVGGGVNGAAIARDAAGRGLRVALAEQGDLASATSSASTKLLHGGLRYLEYLEFKLVRDALKEREILLQNMPHIAWPMRFVLPYYAGMRFEGSTVTAKLLGVLMPWMKGARPAWLIRLGLFLYDHLGGRKILPATSKINLQTAPEGRPLQGRFRVAYEYSDAWVQDSRLVVLMAQDAKKRGANIMTRNKVIGAKRLKDHWRIKTQLGEFKARVLVNAAGPWVEDVLRNRLKVAPKANVQLVKGSHIITHKLYDHDKCYFLQGRDGRIIFTIPYEDDYTLVGTTDMEHKDLGKPAQCSDEEVEYLCQFVSEYFAKPLKATDVISRYAGIRPLYNEGTKSVTAATREYVISVNEAGACVASVFGGKITTHRKLAEEVLASLSDHLKVGDCWTEKSALPGGGFAMNEKPALLAKLKKDYRFLQGSTAKRLLNSYGIDAWKMLGKAKTLTDLGQDFGAGLTSREVDYLLENEFARSAEDILWRRSKLGLKIQNQGKTAIDNYLRKKKHEPHSSH